MVSRKYTTLAKLTRSKFKEITTEFPEMTQVLKRGIQEYGDRMKRYMRLCLRKVEFFDDIEEDAMLDVIFSMEVRNYAEGDILQKPGDVATAMLFI